MKDSEPELSREFQDAADRTPSVTITSGASSNTARNRIMDPASAADQASSAEELRSQLAYLRRMTQLKTRSLLAAQESLDERKKNEELLLQQVEELTTQLQSVQRRARDQELKTEQIFAEQDKALQLAADSEERQKELVAENERLRQQLRKLAKAKESEQKREATAGEEIRRENLRLRTEVANLEKKCTQTETKLQSELTALTGKHKTDIGGLRAEISNLRRSGKEKSVRLEENKKMVDCLRLELEEAVKKNTCLMEEQKAYAREEEKKLRAIENSGAATSEVLLGGKGGGTKSSSATSLAVVLEEIETLRTRLEEAEAEVGQLMDVIAEKDQALAAERLRASSEDDKTNRSQEEKRELDVEASRKVDELSVKLQAMQKKQVALEEQQAAEREKLQKDCEEFETVVRGAYKEKWEKFAADTTLSVEQYRLQSEDYLAHAQALERELAAALQLQLQRQQERDPQQHDDRDRVEAPVSYYCEHRAGDGEDRIEQNDAHDHALAGAEPLQQQEHTLFPNEPERSRQPLSSRVQLAESGYLVVPEQVGNAAAGGLVGIPYPENGAEDDEGPDGGDEHLVARRTVELHPYPDHYGRHQLQTLSRQQECTDLHAATTATLDPHSGDEPGGADPILDGRHAGSEEGLFGTNRERRSTSNFRLGNHTARTSSDVDADVEIKQSHESFVAGGGRYAGAVDAVPVDAGFAGGSAAAGKDMSGAFVFPGFEAEAVAAGSTKATNYGGALSKEGTLYAVSKEGSLQVALSSKEGSVGGHEAMEVQQPPPAQLSAAASPQPHATRTTATPIRGEELAASTTAAAAPLSSGKKSTTTLGPSLFSKIDSQFFAIPQLSKALLSPQIETRFLAGRAGASSPSGAATAAALQQRQRTTTITTSTSSAALQQLQPGSPLGAGKKLEQIGGSSASGLRWKLTDLPSVDLKISPNMFTCGSPTSPLRRSTLGGPPNLPRAGGPSPPRPEKQSKRLSKPSASLDNSYMFDRGDVEGKKMDDHAEEVESIPDEDAPGTSSKKQVLGGASPPRPPMFSSAFTVLEDGLKKPFAGGAASGESSCVSGPTRGADVSPVAATRVVGGSASASASLLRFGGRVVPIPASSGANPAVSTRAAEILKLAGNNARSCSAAEARGFVPPSAASASSSPGTGTAAAGARPATTTRSVVKSLNIFQPPTATSAAASSSSSAFATTDATDSMNNQVRARYHRRLRIESPETSFFATSSQFAMLEPVPQHLLSPGISPGSTVRSPLHMRASGVLAPGEGGGPAGHRMLSPGGSTTSKQTSIERAIRVVAEDAPFPEAEDGTTATSMAVGGSFGTTGGNGFNFHDVHSSDVVQKNGVSSHSQLLPHSNSAGTILQPPTKLVSPKIELRKSPLLTTRPVPVLPNTTGRHLGSTTAVLERAVGSGASGGALAGASAPPAAPASSVPRAQFVREDELPFAAQMQIAPEPNPPGEYRTTVQTFCYDFQNPPQHVISTDPRVLASSSTTAGAPSGDVQKMGPKPIQCHLQSIRNANDVLRSTSTS
mmetsp:Transcript_27775/g.70129  ORF Transcript_27775/g.70129 Transcript_27775/m.70129 type:complete len:1524 (+) Transcript_27775:46-4617(+)